MNNGQKVPQEILLPSVSGKQCVEQYGFLEDECIWAAQSVGSVLQNGSMVFRDWLHTPPGCLLNLVTKVFILV